METAARMAARASVALRFATVRRAAGSVSRRFLQQQSGRRALSNPAAPTATRTANSSFALGAFLLVGGAGFFTLNSTRRPTLAESPEFIEQSSTSPRRQTDQSSPTPSRQDYQSVYNAIAEKLIEEDDYDDGSYAPVLLRLGWHSSGSYDAATNTGGSNGATMRFPPEGELGANSGLRYARGFLETVKAQFPWISYSDLWTLAAVCAVQEMQGPIIPWRPGRRDKDVAYCSPDGRLPDGSKTQNHVRAIYSRMGFDDQEMVVLIGAHAVGRCHVERSGFEGPWTFSPITFTNDFYRLLLTEEWTERDWKGNRQLQDKGSKSLMMLPSDYCLVQDAEFKRHVERYAVDQDLFFDDFSKAMVKLFELGVPFAEDRDGVERIEFERTEQQSET